MIQSFTSWLGLSIDKRSAYFLCLMILSFQVFIVPQSMGLVLVPMLVLLLIERFQTGNWKAQYDWKPLIPFGVTFGLYVIGIYLSDNTEFASFKAEKKILYFLFPFLLWYSPFKLKQSDVIKLLVLYTLSWIIFFVLAHGQIALALIDASKTGKIPDMKAFLLSPDFEYNYRVWLGGKWHIHSTYIGLLLNMSILIGVKLFIERKEHSKIIRTLSIVSISTGLVFLLLISSRMAFISMALALFYVTWKYLKQYRKALVLVFVVGGTLSFAVLVKTNSRFKELVNTKTELPTADNFNSVNVRYGIYACTNELVAEHWLLGLTPGDTQDELNACFESKDMGFIAERKYNSHNEYVNQILCFGVVGLSLFLWIIIQGWRVALKIENALFVGFLIFFTLSCFSENTLERFNGELFFVYFYSIFYWNENTVKDA